MRRETIELAILKMKNAKVKRCPVCREQLSLFDRRHVGEKHPKYFHEVRIWQLANSFSLIAGSVFLIINGLSQDLFVNCPAVTGALISVVFVFLTLLKWRSVTKKYKVPWKNTLPLTGTND